MEMMERFSKPVHVDGPTLRDFLAMHMPAPPTTPVVNRSEEDNFLDNMKTRYEMADRIIKEVR